MGFLDTQSNANNVEAMYVAYFGRGGDGPGYLYWNNQLATEEAGGTPKILGGCERRGCIRRAARSDIHVFLLGLPAGDAQPDRSGSNRRR